jgi:hypothetical protein
LLRFVPNQFDLNFGPDVNFPGLLAAVAPFLARLTGDFPDGDSTTGGGVRAENLIEGHVARRFLDFDDSWLTGMDPSAKFLLGQLHGLTLPSKT